MGQISKSLKLAVIFMISTSVYSFAQRVNEHGLKMVSILMIGKTLQFKRWYRL